MADARISALTQATTLTGAELIPLVQGGTTKQASARLLVGAGNTAATIAALTALTGMADGQVAQPLGYYAAGDGGGGPPRYWSAASTATHNGGSVLQPDSAPAAGRWLWDWSGAINLMWFGVVMDDSTDNASRITAAIAALPSLGGRLYLPGHASYCKSASSITLRQGVIIEGDGRLASKFRFSGATKGFEYSPAVYGEFSGGFEKVGVLGPTGAATALALIRLNNCSQGFLRDVWVRSSSTNCIELDNSAIGFSIENALIEDFVGYGISLGSFCSVNRINNITTASNSAAFTGSLVGIVGACEGVEMSALNVNGSNRTPYMVQVASGGELRRSSIRSSYAENITGPAVKATGTGIFSGVVIEGVQSATSDSTSVDLDNGVAHTDITVRNVRNSEAVGGSAMFNPGSTVNYLAENNQSSAGVTVAGQATTALKVEKQNGLLYVNGEVTGSWTPTITFATPGDLSVAYAASGQIGRYTRIGNLMHVTGRIVTSTFTHTTAAGALKIGGLPTAVTVISNFSWPGALEWRGITKATYTDIVVYGVAGETNLQVGASGSGVAADDVVAADMPTGGTVVLIFDCTYRV